MIKQYLLAMSFGLLTACAVSTQPASITNASVGMVQLSYVDATRSAWSGEEQRPLATTIWYPAKAGSTMTEIAVPPGQAIFIGGDAARGADLSEGGPFPFVLLSHGTGGSAFQMMWLGRALAEKGYIAAAVDHHGNTAAEDFFDARGFRMPWERARDMSAVFDKLLTDNVWQARIDETRLAAIGFSLGGYTVTALAGGITDLDRLAAFCASPRRDATCAAQPEYPDAEADFEELLARDPGLVKALAEHDADFTDGRIKSFVALAPALAQAFTDESLGAIDRPLLVIGGDADAIAPVSTNAERLAQAVAHAQLEPLGGVTHYAFLNRCSPRGQEFVPICKDGPTPRAQAHEQATGLILNHLQATLGGSP